MVTERSASSELEEQPSILAQLRAWSAKHPLRPADGSPPALCDPDEIPIIWAQAHTPWTCAFSGRPSDEPVSEITLTSVAAAMAALSEPGVDDDADLIGRARALLRTAVIETHPWRNRPLFDRLREDRSVQGAASQHLSWLSQHTDQGELIELYIAALGVTTAPGAGETLRILARHPWLHAQAMVALDRRGGDTLDLDWARANHAGCCARRRVLRRITPRLAVRPDIRDWVLRHGGSAWPGDPFVRERVRASNGLVTDTPFEPCVAAARAVAGDLAGALAAPDVDDGLLDAACDIVHDLWGDLGEDDIETCPDGVLILDRLIGHLQDRCTTLRRLQVVEQIHAWLAWPPESAEMDFLTRLRGASDDDWRAWRTETWARREALGWTEEVRAALADDCQRILRQPQWPERVRAAFASYEPRSAADAQRYREGWIAWSVARVVGIDLWDDGLRLLERYPLDGSLTLSLLQADDDERVERVIRLAERLVPRALRDAQAADTSQAGRRRSTYVIGGLIQAMERHPSYSERLVALALGLAGECATAVSVLERRPTESWGDEVIAALRVAVSDQPHQETRERLAALLARLEETDGRA
jgi:hypothetical protein